MSVRAILWDTVTARLADIASSQLIVTLGNQLRNSYSDNRQ